jgi:hypothetical protein
MFHPSNSRHHRTHGGLRGRHPTDVALAGDAVEIQQAGTVVAVERDAAWGPSRPACSAGPSEEHRTDRHLDFRAPRRINYAW